MSPTSLALITESLDANKKLAATFNANRADDELKWRSECQYALDIIRKNEQLQGCDPESVKLAMLEVAYSGLSLAPSLGHAYLIAYGQECSFKPGYKGLIHLCYKAGTLRRIQPGLHKEGDTEYEKWTDERGAHIIHRESIARDRSEKPTLHAYVVTTLHNREILVTDMDQKALLAVEAAASRKNAKGGMVWRSSFRSQMEIKAVIRRQSGLWPRDDGGKMDHAINVMDKYDPIDFEATPRADEPQELLVSDEQQLELHAALTDRGLGSQEADHWLSMKAEAMGYASITQLPARLFEQAKTDLLARYEKVRETRKDLKGCVT